MPKCNGQGRSRASYPTPRSRTREACCAATASFNLHANVRLQAHDRRRLERLRNAIFRPPVSQERLEALPDGLPPKAPLVPPPPAEATDHGARPRQVDWAALLERVYIIDVSSCPRCGGQMRLIAAITQIKAIRAILRACGPPSAPPEGARPPEPCQQSELMWDSP